MYKNSVYAVVSKLIMGGGKVVFVWGVSCFFGPEGQGLVSLGLTVMVSLALFLSLGIELSNTYFIGRNHENASPLIINSLIVSIVSAVPAWLLIEFGFRFFGNTVFQGYPSFSKVILIFLVSLQVFQMLLQGLVIGLGRFKEIAIGTTLQYVFLLLGLFFVVKLDMSFLSILGLWGGGLVVISLYLMSTLAYFIRRNVRPDIPLLKQQITYGSKGMVGNAANFLNFRLDLYIVAYFLTSSHVGWYALASAIAESLLYLPKSISQVVFSTVSNNTKEEKIDLLFRITVFMLFLIMVFAVLVAPHLIPLLVGEVFYPAVLPAQILMFGTFLFGIGFMAAHYLYGHGLPFVPTKASLTAVGVTIILDIFIIPIWGIIGAAFCSLIAYGLYSWLNVKKIREIMSTGKPDIRLRSLLLPSWWDIKTILLFGKECISKARARL